MQIDINIQVLQSGRSELAVVINAFSLALMDARIRMKDFVVAASIGKTLMKMGSDSTEFIPTTEFTSVN